MSHELSIGVSVGQGGQKKRRREYNIPSVINGPGSKPVGQKEATDAFFGKGKEGTLNRAMGRKKSSNRKNVTKSFPDVKSAEKAAKERSSAADDTHRADGTLRARKRK
tara:strand:+ start:4209 stop:4532 length:324 start_codon:yes stop_codon:yes gene_type:complete